MTTSHKRQGYALLVVLVIGGLFMALSAAVGTEVVSNLGATKSRLGQSRARCAAYSGLQHALYVLKNDPDFDEEIFAVLMPNSGTVSYTVEITDNRNGNSPLTTEDGTVVPPGAVHCLSMGIDNENEQVALHAMGGTLVFPRPVLQHAAFADQNLEFSGDSGTQSFDSQTATYTTDADGRCALPAGDLESTGDVGSNRYMAFMDNADVKGKIYRPGEFAQASMLESPMIAPSDILNLPAPIEVPRMPAPPSPESVPQLSANAPTLVPQGTPQSTVAAEAAPTTYQSLELQAGASMTMNHGAYYFPEGLEIDGEVLLGPDVDDDHPVVIYSSSDVVLGDGARVNIGKPARHLQFYFVDEGQVEPPKLKMEGRSQLFATAVGSRLQAVFEGESQLFGGVLGRSVQASDQAKLFFDKSLTDQELDANGAWSFSGLTEPRPGTVIEQSTLVATYVDQVRDGSITYNPPLAAVAATPHSPSM